MELDEKEGKPKGMSKKDEIQSMAKKKKEVQDFSAKVDTELPKLGELAKKEGQLADALQSMFALEKQTRNGGDTASTSRIVCYILETCYDLKKWKELNESLVLISKRRGQEKSVITASVQKASKFVDALTDEALEDKRMELIETLRQITAGKIFLEIERARLTRTLSGIYEHHKNISKAAETLQALQVETFGAMDKKEKTEFILEQIRLCLANNDHTRALILSRKVNKKVFEDAGMEPLKLKYYESMIIYYKCKKSFLQICRCYLEMSTTEFVKQNPERLYECLKLAAVFVSLSVYNNESYDLLNRLVIDKRYDDLPIFRGLMKTFLTMELMQWKLIEEIHVPEIRKLNVPSGDDMELWSQLRLRITEHNLRVITHYYTRIKMSRLAELLGLSMEESEELTTRLVNEGMIYAKMDRPGGIVCFSKAKGANEHLGGWNANISSLLSLIERTSHLIHRENLKLGLK